MPELMRLMMTLNGIFLFLVLLFMAIMTAAYFVGRRQMPPLADKRSEPVISVMQFQDHYCVVWKMPNQATVSVPAGDSLNQALYALQIEAETMRRKWDGR
jgi:hypothetical protein